MFPITLLRCSGAGLHNGMARVIIDGMSMSTLLTLVVVPLVYKILHPVRPHRKEKPGIEKLMYAKRNLKARVLELK